MCIWSLRRAVSVFLKVTCVLITLLMIHSEIQTYIVVRPTITVQETKLMDMGTFPRVFACAEKPFNTKVLLENGYSKDIMRYGLGALGQARFKEELKTTGWSGNQTRDSTDLLEQLVTIKSESDFGAYEVGNFLSYSYANRKLTKATYPYGKCVEVSHKTGNLNNSITITPELPKNNSKVKVILRDRIHGKSFGEKSSILKGDQIIGKEGMRREYRIKVKQTLYEENDPKFKCTRYSERNSLDFCVRGKIYARLMFYLGCLPPLFAFVGDENDTCRQNFDFSSDQERMNITYAMLSLFVDSRFARICEDTCTQATYETTLLEEVPSDRTRIHLYFDNTVDIVRISFRVDFQTFLTRLGGAVSFGRTGLWIFITTFDLVMDVSKVYKTLWNFVVNEWIAKH